jgi:hypothetical protein
MGVMVFALALPGGCRQTGRSGLIQSADLPDFIQVGEIYDFYFGNVGVVVEVLEVRSNGCVKGRVILGGEGERWWNIRQLVVLRRKPLRMIESKELGWGPGREESP